MTIEKENKLFALEDKHDRSNTEDIELQGLLDEYYGMCPNCGYRLIDNSCRNSKCALTNE